MTLMATRLIVTLPQKPEDAQIVEEYIDEILYLKKIAPNDYWYEFFSELPDGIPVGWEDQLKASLRDKGPNALYLAIYVV